MSNLDLLERAVATAFYEQFPELRPAQQAAIPPLIAGENIVLSSATGSGKTEAVMAPLLSRVWRYAVEAGCLSLLYVAPTKALVNDLEKRLSSPCSKLGLRVGVRHGDRDDIAAGRAPHVLITTPESLDVLLYRKDPALFSVRAVVIDEAHLLYNTQRGLHLSILLRRLQRCGVEFQWALLSATIANLPHLRDFLFGPDEASAFVECPTNRPIDAKVLHPHSEREFAGIVGRLSDGRPIKLLVFANSRQECERLASALADLPGIGSSVFAHYSSLSTEYRLETERRFAESRCGVCVATSTLELGIDIGDIDAVMLWGAPANVESFLQRIGRGCRRTHKTNVICLVPDTSKSPVLDAARFTALVDAARQGLMPVRPPYQLFGAVAQQCLSVIASNGGRFTRAADLLDVVGHADYLDRATLDSILDELAAQGYVQRHGFKNQYGADEGLHRLVDYRLIYGNMPASSQEVEVRHASKVLGHVPSWNLLRLRRGAVVRFAGRRWQVEKFSPGSIILTPTERRDNAIDFVYSGSAAGCDTFVTDRMWAIIHDAQEEFDLLSQSIGTGVRAAAAGLRTMCGFSQIPCVAGSEGLTYVTFGGRLVNKAIPLIDGQEPSAVSDILFTVPTPVQRSSFRARPEDYAEVQHLLPEQRLDQTIYQTLLPTELQLREYLEEWLRDPNIADVLRRLAGGEVVDVPAAVVQPWLSCQDALPRA